jgi:Xaa-Pro dipeptidase
MKGNAQAFSTEEFKSRLRGVQQSMSEQGLDVLLVHAPENIYYLTGYQTSGYFAYQTLIVTETDHPTLLVRFLERGNVDEYSWLLNEATWKEGDDVVGKTVNLVKELRGEKKTVGLEKASWFLTAQAAEEIGRGLPSARIVDASWLVDKVRLIKSEAEIRYIRQAAAIAELQQRVALDAIRPGVTEADVAAAVHFAGIKAGNEYTGLPHHVMSGYRYNVCHANWGPKVIKKGELVLLELYGCVERYHATQMRTVSVGAPSDEAKRAAELIIDSQDRAFSALRPGASSREIDALVRGPLRKVRKEYFNRTGYSTGIGFPPRTAEWQVLDFNEDSDWEVRAGMVFHMLALAQNVGFSETVVVTDTGSVRLTPTNPRELLSSI